MNLQHTQQNDANRQVRLTLRGASVFVVEGYRQFASNPSLPWPRSFRFTVNTDTSTLSDLKFMVAGTQWYDATALEAAELASLVSVSGVTIRFPADFNVDRLEAVTQAEAEATACAQSEREWQRACNEKGWDAASQHRMMEAFLRDRGLFGQMLAYAGSAEVAVPV